MHTLPVKQWRYIDESLMQSRSPLESFAMDDTLCHLIGHEESRAAIRTWVHTKSVVLGIQDHRLPYIEEGTKQLQLHGFAPIVRNSGGLAVVLDPGVLNISMIFKDNKTEIDTAFSYMVTLTKTLFPQVANKIEAYEIIGSYCPGSFDLSIGGKKFAGISQRRMQGGIAVQIYLCIEGSGSERAALIRDFYEVSLQGEDTKFTYPTVDPTVMASMQELTASTMTVTDVTMRLQQLLVAIDPTVEREPVQEMPLYTHYLERIFKRNALLLK